MIVNWPSTVETDLFAVIAAHLHLYFMAINAFRASADHVQQAPWWRLTIDRRGGATQDGNTLEIPGFNFRHRVGALGQGQAVKKLRGLEATYF
ncbi:hypothetical protein D9M73_290000 [compost metagenome]